MNPFKQTGMAKELAIDISDGNRLLRVTNVKTGEAVKTIVSRF